VITAVVVACTSEVEVPVEVVKEVEVVVEKVVVATAAPLTGSIAVEQAKYGGSMTVVSQASIKTLDLDFTGAYVTSAVGIHIWEKLFGWDNDFVPQPQMVDSWNVSSDGMTFEFTLRDDLVFHNGGTVTVSDVIPSIKRALERHPPMKIFARFVEGFEELNDRTFSMSLHSPYAEVVPSLGRIRRSGVVWPKDIAVLSPNEDVGESNIIGSGPYKVGKWEIGNRVILERHDGYVPRTDQASNLAGAQIPYLDQIIFVEIPDEEVKIAGLRTGEWDMVDGASLDFFKDLDADPSIGVGLYKPGHMSGVNLKHDYPPTDNLKVRQAIQAAIDAEAYMSALGDSDLWQLCPAIFFCGTPLETDVRSDLYNQNDLQKAKQLLAESGYDGETFKVLTPTDYGTITPLGPVFRSALEDIGFNVDMPAMDWATVVSSFQKTEDWNGLTTWCIHSNNMDPLTMCYTQTGGITRYENPAHDDAISNWASAFDPVEKRKWLDIVQRNYYEDVMSVHFGHFYSLVPHSTVVKNFAVTGVRGMPVYINVWLER
jgi:peptide/nickel transport system substrate-binding protein